MCTFIGGMHAQKEHCAPSISFSSQLHHTRVALKLYSLGSQPNTHPLAVFNVTISYGIMEENGAVG